MQTLELPQTVRIGPFDYDVNPTGWQLPDKFFGQCRNRDLQIIVDDTVPAMQVADTYLHEILHALWFTTGLGDQSTEEGAVRTLSTAFLGFLQDNPNGLDPVHEAIGIQRRKTLATKLNGGLVGQEG